MESALGPGFPSVDWERGSEFRGQAEPLSLRMISSCDYPTEVQGKFKQSIAERASAKWPLRQIQRFMGPDKNCIGYTV